MLKRLCQGLTLWAALICLTGCWNRRELNELSIASAYGLDKIGTGYQISVQLINGDEVATNKGGGGGNRMPVVTQVLAHGNSIFESVRQLSTSTPRKIYSSHIQMLVIGETLARDGIAKVLDALSRDHEMRTDFYIAVAKDATAADVLKVLSPLEKIPSHKLFASLESVQNAWGGSTKVDLHQLIYDLVSKGKDPVLAALRITGDPEVGQSKRNLNSVNPPVLLQYDGLAVFNKDRLVGWLNQEESKGYNYITGGIKSTIVPVPCPEGGQLGIELIRTDKSLKGKVTGGQPQVNLHIDTEGNVGEVECHLDLSEPETIRLLERGAEDKIKETVQAAVKKAQKYKADIFGFGDAIHRADPKAWRQLEPDWNQHFGELTVQVTVDMNIRRTGSVVESFLGQLGK
ncbi:Ger(x)C family spore germination protein [Paenibacillus rigui]|uniref:Spore gernimation protein GerC n=1 Tax=Paenibacillus rigui TaxID=554312 RepID=A0A229UPI2_9BACL|nr:Ger(x)C family spore germination protein [Paenibacillus rigui]OXM85274.1 spore gernimation protein GerC [Paenibacillus rigui]